ncbi:MAG: ornithine cyclodeaminase family protein, partial [Beijerinckiaceae bacterium]
VVPDVAATESLETAVREADVISCATLSREPLVHGEWLKPGAHLDLVGAYSPAMRESDDACVTRSRIFVDTRGGALKEAGDIVQPIASGTITESAVLGDLYALCREKVLFQRRPADITLFKSVGAAIEDLAAAILVHDRLKAA